MADVLAEGYNVFDTSKSPTGTIKYLEVPADVIGLIQSGKLQEHILLVLSCLLKTREDRFLMGPDRLRQLVEGRRSVGVAEKDVSQAQAQAA